MAIPSICQGQFAPPHQPRQSGQGALNPRSSLDDSRGDGVDKGSMVFVSLVGVGTGELCDCPVEAFGLTQVRADGDGIARASMSPCQRPTAHLAIDG